MPSLAYARKQFEGLSAEQRAATRRLHLTKWIMALIGGFFIPPQAELKVFELRVPAR